MNIKIDTSRAIMRPIKSRWRQAFEICAGAFNLALILMLLAIFILVIANTPV